MIRSVASLARRVAGMPGRLALGLAVLALAAAAICGAIPSGTRPAGPAYAVAAVPAMSSARMFTAAPEAQARQTASTGAGLDRPFVCAADFESGPADLGLGRVPTDAPRRARATTAVFRFTSDAILASAPGGWPLRPPRVA